MFFSILIGGVILLVLSISMLLADNAEIIANVGWVLITLVVIVNIIIAVFRKASIGNKIAGVMVSVVGTGIMILASRTFFGWLSGINELTGIERLFEFTFVFAFGGMLYLAIDGLCIGSSVMIVDAEDYLTSAGCLIGATVLAGVFGFFG